LDKKVLKRNIALDFLDEIGEGEKKVNRKRGLTSQDYAFREIILETL
jgi:hypothetical protein